MLVLIPAHDDADALRAALPAVMAAARAGRDRVVVVADRCTDDTAGVARAAGADVVVRNDASAGPGKGGALLFALRSREGEPAEPVAVFDADSEPSPGFFVAAEEAFAGDARALQAFVAPAPGRSLVARIAAYSEIVSQKIGGRLRERLGWGVPLRGTGMVVERGLLADGLTRCETFVEDLELTLLLEASGVRIRSVASSVRDPKPERASGVVAQRARWLAGNLAALRSRRKEIRRLLGTVAGATLVVSLFAKPRSLFFSARLVLLATLVAIGAAGPGWRALEVLLGVFVLRDLALLFGGLAVVDRPAFYAPAVFAAPIYPLLWAAGAARSLSSRGRWLSARRNA